MIETLAAGAVYLCVVSRVWDGDTWDCRDGARVRAWGFNAAELKEPGGVEAGRWLRSLVQGRTLACAYVETDKYGRLVSRCSVVADRDLGEMAVSGGHAHDCPRFSGGAYAEFEEPGVERAPFCEKR